MPIRSSTRGNDLRRASISRSMPGRNWRGRLLCRPAAAAPQRRPWALDAPLRHRGRLTRGAVRSNRSAQLSLRHPEEPPQEQDADNDRHGRTNEDGSRSHDEGNFPLGLHFRVVSRSQGAGTNT